MQIYVLCNGYGPALLLSISMVSAGYLWERFVWLSFFPWLLWIAATNPAYYCHLTYWTLTLHCIYWTVDKSSPNATPAIYLLHGASFAGSVMVFMAYSFISIGGIYKFSGPHSNSHAWLLWENAIGAAAGTVQHDRGWNELAVQKAYEHVWPMFASIVDCYLNRGSLQAAFAGARPGWMTLKGVGSYLAFATGWEVWNKMFETACNHGNPLEIYVQPQEFYTAAIFERFGLGDATGLPKDLVFTNLHKIVCTSFGFFMYWIFVSPVMKATAPPPGKGKGKAKAS